MLTRFILMDFPLRTHGIAISWVNQTRSFSDLSASPSVWMLPIEWFGNGVKSALYSSHLFDLHYSTRLSCARVLVAKGNDWVDSELTVSDAANHWHLVSTWCTLQTKTDDCVWLFLSLPRSRYSAQR